MVKQGQAQLESAEKRLTDAQAAAEAKIGVLKQMEKEIKPKMAALTALSKAMRKQSEGNASYTSNLDELDGIAASISSVLSGFFSSQDSGKDEAAGAIDQL